MEAKDNHRSLPSNYVTLAQLQERWLKQKEEEKQLREKQQQEQQQKQEQQQNHQQQNPKLPQRNPREHYRGQRPKAQQQLAWKAIPARSTGLGHAAEDRPSAESGPKNLNVPVRNRVVVWVDRETNESVEAKVDIGDGSHGQDGKKKQLKKNWKSWKGRPRADTENKMLSEDAAKSAMERNKEVANSDVKTIDEKAETKIELNNSKSNGLVTEVKQKLGTTSIISEREKQNSRVKTYDSSRGSQMNNGGRSHRNKPYRGVDEEKKKLAEEATQSPVVELVSSDVKRIDEKAETKIELNDSKSNGLMMEVEQALGTISINSENEKLNSRVKTYDSSRGFQRHYGGRNHRIRPSGRARKKKAKLVEDATHSTMVGNKELVDSDVQRVDDKRETKIELNGSTSNNLMSGVEQKLGTVSMNSENEKEKGSEINNLMSEVEQKLGTISMNSEDEKDNSRVKTYNGYRGSQRNNRGQNYTTGHYGGRFRALEVQRRCVDQKIWVRKSENSNGKVDQNEISSK